MRFGPVAVADAEGSYLGHALDVGQHRLAKGTKVTGAHVEQMIAVGLERVIVAALDEGDLHEDAAAATVARALDASAIRVDRPSTGRVNLFSETDGLFLADAAQVNAINAVDPAITLATLPHASIVRAGQMVATVKIIPFAVPGALVEAAIAGLDGSVLTIAPFKPLRVALVQTVLPSLKASVQEKTARRTGDRVAALSGTLQSEHRCPHDEDALANILSNLRADHADLIVIFGASAVTDANDVVPSAIRLAGGTVVRVGMPVDPGNLIVVARTADGRPVIGAPGCARSPKENGFDWVLARIFAGLDVTSGEIAAMGVGGLLTEIETRPRPRLVRP